MRRIVRICIFIGLALLIAGQSPAVFAYSSYASMTRRLKADCAAKPSVLHLFNLGPAAVSLRPIWMVRITAQRGEGDIRHGLRALLICRQHGDEPVSTEAALRFVHEFVRQTPAATDSELGPVTLYIIPMANPDGADSLNRLNGVGGDMNRDWGRFRQPETRAVYRAYAEIKPQVVVDFHSWTPTDSFQANSVEACRQPDSTDGITGAEALLIQRQIVESVQSECGQAMMSIGYAPSDERTLCHRFFAEDKNVVSLLVETAAGGTTMPQMQTRIAIDDAVFHCLIDAMVPGGMSWSRIAVAEGSEIAPRTAYTLSPTELAILDAQTADADRAKAQTAQSDRRAYAADVEIVTLFIAALVLLTWYNRELIEALWLRSTANRHDSGEGTIYVSPHPKTAPASVETLRQKSRAAKRTESGRRAA